MHIRNAVPARLLLAVAALLSLGALPSSAQVSDVAPRITQAIDNSQLTVLRGNVHPLARPAYDRGAAPASLAMDHMLLVLKRSPQQESALDSLLAQQQDRNSPNYHRWLTPAQFGAQFGPSDQDIAAIENWLESEGFSIDSVSKGRTVIEFSGSAGEVLSAFHTEIHRYVLPTGAEHWANSTDPEIPAALAPVVAGIHSLNNFFPRPLSRVVTEKLAARGSAQNIRTPQYTFAASGDCSAVQFFENDVNPICFMVTPVDFATIYNVVGLWNAGHTGTGETIAIANDSNVNLSDISNFRSLMGLPAKNLQVILATGVDPGIQAPCSTQTCSSDGDESEADLDVEWSGAVAENATIDLVIAPSPGQGQLGQFGGDIAAEYIVDNNVAPILSYSFGACENSGVGTFYGPLWQQAAAEGITVLVASGDNGSAGCDANLAGSTTAEPATGGLQVNGLASTPYNVAVGGTDFNDVTNPGNYWNLNNSTSTSQASALGYVPETAWNESCTNAIFSTPPLSSQFGGTQEAACNSAAMASNGFVVPSGGSGGASAFYSKPAWQTGITPTDSARDLPDVSLFAGTGAVSASFYYVCESDLSQPAQTCSLSGSIDGAGGTSVSAQVFAGIVALIDQKAGAPQGNIDPLLYGLYTQGSNKCLSSSPTASCMFYDVTAGTNAMPCLTGSLNCVTATNGDANGILETGGVPAYNAGTGFDLATGLGSINAQNLAAANVWVGPSGAADFSITSSSPTVNIGSNHQGMMAINIAPQNGFNGAVNLSCPGLPTGDTCSFSTGPSVTISSSTDITVTVSGTISSVPGGMDRPSAPGDWGARTEITFAFACFAALLLLALRIRRRRWNMVLALSAFALFAIAGCSGSSGSPSGNNGGSGPSGSSFMTTVTATTCSNGGGCSGGTTHSLAFTVE
jgi:subtilase family serine protease